MTRNHPNPHTRLFGRMTPAERSVGRFLRSPDGHDTGADAAALADAGITAEPDPADTPADAAKDAVAGDPAVDGDASPGDAAADGAEGATDEGAATSDDAANAEAAAPFEGLVAPEGFASLDAEALTLATPILRSLGVETTDQAQAAINQFGPVVQGIAERTQAAVLAAQETARADMVKTWADEVKADPEIGGANYDRATALAAAARDRFFEPEFTAFLEETGLGSHPAMIRGCAKIGTAIADDPIHLGGAGSRTLQTHEKLYDSIYNGPQPTT